MRPPRTPVLSIVLFFAGVSGVAAERVNDAHRIVGVWETAPGHEDGRARIAVVEEEGGYTGRIVWLEQPVYPDDDPQGMGGRPRMDRENPDPSLRDRPVMGLTILRDLRYDGEGTWRGTIYDADRGRVYRCKVRLGGPGELKLRGYIGIPLLGGTTTWTRFDDGMPRTAPASPDERPRGSGPGSG